MYAFHKANSPMLSNLSFCLLNNSINYQSHSLAQYIKVTCTVVDQRDSQLNCPYRTVANLIYIIQVYNYITIILSELYLLYVFQF